MTVAVPACQPIAARLPRIDPAAAGVSRLVHDRRLRAAWWDAVDGLEFVPLAASPGDAVQRVVLETAHGPVEALVSAPDFPSLAVAASQPPDTPAPLLALAAEAALQPVLAALAALGLADVGVAALTTLHDAPDTVPRAGWVRVQVHGRPVADVACTRLPDVLLQGLRHRLAPPRFMSRFARALALPGDVRLAGRPVRRAVLDSLAPGDVLLLAPGGPAEQPACHVRIGARGGRRWQAAVAVDDTFLTLQGAGRMIDEDAQDDDLAPTDLSAAAPPDLEVPVRFEVDTVAVPLALLEGLGHGQVIALAAPLAGAPLRLVACGRVIGHAELVAVGDRLGARITHMASPDAERSGH